MGEQVAAGSQNGGIAQLGEHLPCKQGVKSSNLSVSIASLYNWLFSIIKALYKGTGTLKTVYC